MANDFDIITYNLTEDYGQDVLNVLLTDRSVTQYKNDGMTHHIFWGTHDYEPLGEGYAYYDEIVAGHITGEHADVVMPRIMKKKNIQSKRTKNMAEIFTPAWVCNFMVNNIDQKFFGRRDVFNREIGKDRKTWETNREKIAMPEGKTWEDYVKLRWMEITCGEAPFMTSRYDTTTGQPIKLEDRIGFLDRKLRIVNENNDNHDTWMRGATMAYQNCLAYEWQGDNLLLARKSLLYAFIDNYEYKFGERPAHDLVMEIADIISWNIWQMDGLKFVIPNSCHDVVTHNLYGEEERNPCPGCKTGNIHKHNGIPVLVKSFETGEAYPYHIVVKEKEDHERNNP